MSSIRQVAREAGVSIATVSRVINGSQSVAPELRKKVLIAVDACGYSPSTGRKQSDSVALVYTGPFCVGSPYDSACLEGIVEVMRETSYDLKIIDLQRDRSPNEKLKHFFQHKGIAGAIVRCTAEDRPAVAEIAESGLPTVVLGDHFDVPEKQQNVSFVYAESKAASREAVEHLVSLGHTRIGFAACDRDDGDHLDRLLAYREVLDEMGLRDETLERRIPPHRLDGAQLMRNLLGRPNPPTAIYIADPLVAVGAMNEACRMGVSVPDDLSIIGFDDTDTRGFVHPRMSAVCQDSKALGNTALRVLVDTIEGNKPQTEVEPLNAWLDLGGTTSSATNSPQRFLATGDKLLA